MQSSLQKYIEQAKAKNIPDDKIRETLVHAGWPVNEVELAFKPKSEEVLIPPPPVPHLGMWTGFLYILFFIALYTLATSMGGLFHIWVDKLFPNPDRTSSFSYFSWDNTYLIRTYLSSIIVAYPIFAYLSWVLNKQLGDKPIVRNIRSRKILIYITLIVSFLIIFGNIIKTIYDYLDGSITMNSVGHLLVTLLVAGGIFGYFLSVIKDDKSN